jgi:hypothetical protein
MLRTAPLTVTAAASRCPRTVVVIACAVSAGVHAGLVPSHLAESRALGIAFAGSALVLLWGAAGLAAADEPGAWAAPVAALLGGLIVAYAASRTVGLPLPGTHVEPVDAVGLVTQLVQGAGLCAALWLCQPARDPMSLAHRKESP